MNTPQDIEALTQRYHDLSRKKTQAETRLASAKEELGKLLAQAKAEFGTDDVTELRRILDERKAENERRRVEYQASLHSIETELAKIAEQHQRP